LAESASSRTRKSIISSTVVLRLRRRPLPRYKVSNFKCERSREYIELTNIHRPRGGQGSPETPPAEIDELLVRPVSQRSDEEATYRAVKRDSALNIFSQAIEQPASPELDTNPTKRRRYNDFTPSKVETENAYVSRHASPEDRKSGTLPVSRRSSEQLFSQWTTNPYNTDERVIMDMMETYFAHISTTTYDMLPKKPFLKWLADRGATKSKDDLMLIYTMLALASVFSSNPEHKKRGEDYAAVSRYACDNRHFSLQLVQSRLLLAMYYYANDNPNDSWDFCGSAIRAATGMKLNQELEATGDGERDVFPFNLNRNGFAECRRRTFWSAYIMDRFNGFCSGHLSVLHTEDVFLRLPSDFKSFNEQVEVNNPYFDADAYPTQTSLTTIGAMAYLVNITSIWGDVMANVYRSSQRPSSFNSPTDSPGNSRSTNEFLSFYKNITTRLESWHASLPPSLVASQDNLSNASKHGILGTFLTIHSLYHTTHMKLNRYVNPGLLSNAQLQHNFRVSYSHAEAMLELCDAITVAEEATNEIIPLSAPFIGYAIISAVDISTRSGLIANRHNVSEKLRSATKILQYLARSWQSARHQCDMVLARVVEVSLVEDNAVLFAQRERENPRWQMVAPMEKTWKRANDCVYGSSLEDWAIAMNRS
jgi:hypothetical protein